MTEERQLPSVAALVLNWCAEADTAKCVTSLLDQRYPALEVAIIDNASPDGSGDRLARRFPDAHYIQTGANLGYAGGNCVGIQWALERASRYVLVINDDAFLFPGALLSLVDAIQGDPRAGIAAPTIIHAGQPDKVWWAGGRFDRIRVAGVHTHFGGAPPSPQSPPRDAEFISGCVMLIRSEALFECGGFDSSFHSYAEDLDLCIRFRGAGWRTIHVPAARAAHSVAWPPAPPAPFAIEQRDRNRRRVARRHLSLPARLLFASWFYPTRIVLIGMAAMGRDRDRARALWRGAIAPLPPEQHDAGSLAAAAAVP